MILRNLLLTGLFFAASHTAAYSNTSELPQSPVTVAVLDFEISDSRQGDFGKELSLLLTTYLSMSQDLHLVERAELEQLLGEQELGLSGNVESASAAQIGKLTGAKILVTGRSFTAGRDRVTAARIMGTETGRVFGELISSPPNEPVTTVAQQLAEKISEKIAEQTGALVAPVQPKIDIVAKLRAQFEGLELPTLYIKIPEEHLSRPVLDPAAETEIGLILGQAGFPLLDNPNADYRIEGEAFSELGMRRGNLVSCRARVEVKVIERSTGRILAMDRQTEVAVDLAESVAAKNALQIAAAKLAERIAAVLPQS